eukprot:scaffold106652_cov22-Tisochrysis_lutea.AAC.5
MQQCGRPGHVHSSVTSAQDWKKDTGRACACSEWLPSHMHGAVQDATVITYAGVLYKMPQSSHMQGAVQDATDVTRSGCCAGCHSHHASRVLCRMPQIEPGCISERLYMSNMPIGCYF